MSGTALACPRCQAPLPATLLNHAVLQPCPKCAARLWVAAFPAWLTERPTQAGEALVLDQDAGCFYHQQKKATTVCEHCGRFLCALCDVELNGRHLCPGCIEAGQRKRQLQDLEHHRLLYDSIALGLAVVPLLMWPLTLVTAPAAIYIAIRHRHAPGSLVRRWVRPRLWLALLIASGELVGWGAGLYLLLT